MAIPTLEDGLRAILAAHRFQPTAETVAECVTIVEDSQEEGEDAWHCARELCLATDLSMAHYRFPIAQALVHHGYFRSFSFPPSISKKR